MTKLVLPICLLSILTLSASAQSSPPSATNAGAPACDESIVRSCRAAVGELAAARKLIETLQGQIDASNAALEIQKQRTQLLAEQNGLLQTQVEEYRAALEAERQARAKLEELNGKFQIRVADLERKSKRGPKFAAAGFLAGVLVGAAAGR